MALLEKFAEAIQIHEGWFAGSRSQRNHNPGNLKFANQKNCIAKDDKGFAIFANDSDGWQALLDQINFAISGKSKVYKPEMTILQFFEHYAPSADQNNPLAYAQAVALHIGKTIEFQIKDLTAPAVPVIEKKRLEIRINDEIIFKLEI